MSPTPTAWQSETVPVAGIALHLARAGSGAPLLVLHHDVGRPEPAPFDDALARQFSVLAPSHPGYDKSARPAWMRSVRDVAVVYQWLLGERGLARDVTLVGLGFSDQRAFDRLFGAEPSTAQLEQWDLNREMTFRIAWKPYMYGPTLPHLLGGVATPTLVVWGRDDRIVPLECGERYAKSLPHARLAIVEGAGHFVDMEQPDELAQLVTRFVNEA